MPAPTINSIVDRALRAIKRDAIPAHLRRRGDQSEIDMDSMGAIIREAVTQGSQLGGVGRNEFIDKRVFKLDAAAKPPIDKVRAKLAQQRQDDQETMIVTLARLKDKCGLKEARELVERNSGATAIKDVPHDKMRKVTRAAKIKLAAVRRKEVDREM